MLGNGSDNEANTGRIQRMSNAAGARPKQLSKTELQSYAAEYTQRTYI